MEERKNKVLPYIGFLVVGALAALGQASDFVGRRRNHALLGVFFVALVIFGGFRFEVGSDWGQYLIILKEVQWQSFAEALNRSEPGYMLINYLGVWTGGGIVFVNLICVAISSLALFRVCRDQVRPWLAAFIVFTTVFVLIVMGLSRQGVAVAVSMLAIHRLTQGERLKFLILVSFAVLFHYSAFVLFSLIVVLLKISWIWRFLILIVVAIGISALMFLQMREYIVYQYIEYGRDSSGAIFRFALHIFVVLAFLAFKKRLGLNDFQRIVFGYVCLGVLLLSLGLLIMPSSTLLDRLAFYSYILHVVVFTRLPNAIGGKALSIHATLVVIILIYLAQFLVWLNFGMANTRFVPYQMTWFGMEI